jgi:mannose-6-phosphate isomerase-like protein (cupin superfamily)
VEVLRIDDGEVLSRTPARDLVVLADRPELSITWTRHLSGEPGTDPHVHHDHTDAFFVLEGELTFTVGPDAEQLRLGPGGLLSVPPDVAHGYANVSGAEASWLNLHAPQAGFLAYVRSLFEGPRVAFDQDDPPEDGGRPVSEATIVRPGEVPVRAELPGLTLLEWPDLATAVRESDAAYVVDAAGRALAVTLT